MKVLLLTDVPPCLNFTAGLVLDQLCSFLPPDALACFTVINPTLDPQLAEWLNRVPFEQSFKPREDWGQRRWPWGALASVVMESYTQAFEIPRLVQRIVAFGRQAGVDRLWCVLQGQTMIRLAVPVAEKLGVPLLTQVWDPPGWWMRENRVQRLIAAGVLADFGRALRQSQRFAAASWAMAEAYSHDYNVAAVPVVPGLERSLAQTPAEAPHARAEIVIGMAGQLYATTEWHALLSTLANADWKLAGRQVRIRLLGRWAGLLASSRMNIEFLGWCSQPETIQLLAESDILFCPYWFDPVFETEARLSFPSKLTTYLAAGRPVFFLGPSYASPARFLERHQAGACVHSLDQGAIRQGLENLIQDVDLYASTTRNGRRAFETHLTFDVLRRSYCEFIGASDMPREL